VGSLAGTAVYLFVALALVGMGAFVLALTVAHIARRHAEAAAAERRQRAWGGRDYARLRTKYFEKERRARSARAYARPALDPDAPARPRAPEPPSDLERAYRETLELAPGELDPDAIRAAYVQRMREYHPDRVAGLGVKIRRLAEEETKQINEAYGFFRQRLGF